MKEEKKGLMSSFNSFAEKFFNVEENNKSTEETVTVAKSDKKTLRGNFQLECPDFLKSTPKEATPTKADLEESTPTESILDESASADSALEESTPKEFTLDESASAEVALDESTPEEFTLDESASAEVALDESTPEEFTLNKSASADTAPEESTPTESTLDKSALADATPEEYTPAQSAPAPAESSPLKRRMTRDIISGNADIGKYFSQYQRAKTPEEKSHTRLYYLISGNPELCLWLSEEAPLELIEKLPLDLWNLIDQQLQ